MSQRRVGVVAAVFVCSGLASLASLASGCSKRELPGEMVASYTRPDTPADLRAELSIARGGMVLTVIRLSASMEMGAFSTLFAGKSSATGVSGAKVGASADVGRSVASARTFKSVSCDKSACRFELAAEDGQEACEGSFERLENTLIVIASGACKPYSGRWVLLEGARPPGSAPASSGAPVSAADAAAPKLEFPPDIPAPKDHMSCLDACSIMDTRCHRTREGMGRESFLACVEKGQICRARCEEVFPFFGNHGSP